MTVTHDEAVALMGAMTTLTIEATAAEMRAAAYVIALEARAEHPTATRVHLSTSDQGDWLCLDRWSDPTGQGGDFEGSEDAQDAASHLYLPQISRTPDGGAVPGLWHSQEQSWQYDLDVDRVLREYAAPVVAEVLTVRDPDGPTTVELTVLGMVPPVGTVSEYAVDAGAGHEWESWVEHRDGSLASASDAMRPMLLDAFSEPPGGWRYIEGCEGRDWLDGSPYAPQEAR